MQSTDLAGDPKHRPLTSEYLPFTTTPTDRSGGFFPHLEEKEAASKIKLYKMANKLDKIGCYDISDSLIRFLHQSMISHEQEHLSG